MKPTYLYIKQHSKTGIKYFGKTTSRYPKSYFGSGKYWKLHINKHGKEHVETLWFQLFTDETELVEYSKKFSEENNIVSSGEWTNLKTENGLDGGCNSISNTTAKKISSSMKGKNSGSKNGMFGKRNPPESYNKGWETRRKNQT